MEDKIKEDIFLKTDILRILKLLIAIHKRNTELEDVVDLYIQGLLDIGKAFGISPERMIDNG